MTDTLDNPEEVAKYQIHITRGEDSDVRVSLSDAHVSLVRDAVFGRVDDTYRPERFLDRRVRDALADVGLSIESYLGVEVDFRPSGEFARVEFAIETSD